jgi:soluble lytic murein transglycosylase-like protein
MLKRANRSIVTALVVAGSLLACTREARADILVLANGGTLSVKDYRIDGDLMTVTLRRGGQATFDRSIVARIAEDEVPDSEPTALEETPVVQGGPAIADLSGRPFADMIEAVAARHGVDPVIVHAVIQAESNYEPRARSNKGARGLMQVLPSTARQFGGGNLYDPRDNLDRGVRYLKGLLAEFDLKQAIAAYNAGPAAVRRYGGVPPFAETQNYVERVLANIPH